MGSQMELYFMIAVIIGSTGLVGSVLLQKLLSDNEIQQVISVSRRSVLIDNKKLKEIIISDLSDLPDHQNALKGDIYFCCLGTTIKSAGSQENFRKVDYDAIVNFGKIAKANNAQSFVVVSAMGANPRSLFFYSRVKGDAEMALQELGLNQLVIFRPSLLIGSRKDFRLGEVVAERIFKSFSCFHPDKINKKLMTNVNGLVDKMIAQGKLCQYIGNVFVEASEI